MSVAISTIDATTGWGRVRADRIISVAGRDDDIGPAVAPKLDELDFRRVAAAARQSLFDNAPAPVRVGRFTLLERIGAGSMGTVYTAYDPELDRKVAVKLIRREATRDSDIDSRQRRLGREARALAKVQHPNVIAVHEVGLVDEQVFIAMEFVDGGNLSTWLAESKRAAAEILVVFGQAGRGLAAAHRAGLVHRDVKPANIMRGADGRARMTDFGLAREHGTNPDHVVADETPTVDATMTATGALVGTPSYMAPEQLDGEPADARSDQFAFCVALYEALYGERPFHGELVGDLRRSMDDEAVVASPERGVSRRVRRALERGLSVAPAARFESMDELLVELAPASAARAPLWAAVGAIAVVGSIAAVVIATRSAQPSQCKAAPSLIEEVWNADRDAEIGRAFQASAVPYAADAWTRAASRIDVYTAGWIEMHTASCRATRVSGEQAESMLDARTRCLEAKRAELDATLEVFANPTPKLMTRAVDIIAGLPSVDSCGDLEALAATVPPPAGAAERAALGELSSDLARARALRRTGGFREGVVVAADVVERADAIGHEPTRAEALFAYGGLQLAAGDTATAKTTLFDAVRAAEAGGHTRVFARAATSLITAAAKDADLETGLLWAGLAEAAIERLGGGASLEAERLSSLGTLLHNDGKVREAVGAHQRALDVYAEGVGIDDPRYANLLHNLGSSKHSLGDYAASEAALREALEIRERILGDSHPYVATTYNNLAILAETRGDHEGAISGYRHGLAIAERALGPDHPDVATYLDNFAGPLRTAGKVDEALALRQRALAIRETALGPDHTAVAMSLNNLGVMLYASGDKAGGIASYRRARAIRQKHFGDEHPDVALVMINLGEAEVLAGETEVGVANVENAARIAENALGAEHLELAYYLLTLGRLYADIGRRDEGIVHLERALVIGESDSAYPGELAETRFALAKLLWSSPTAQVRARELAVAARDAFRERDDVDDLAEVTAWLASRD
jgi:tetratricopeptide (TPR) repeat protein/tRNA A-37 threonylcarbamoyl transferase component Bud32